MPETSFTGVKESARTPDRATKYDSLAILFALSITT